MQSMKKKYSTLYSKIESILFQYDLMGINFGNNFDEYSPEVNTILPRLEHANNFNDVAIVIRQEFQYWFKENIAPDNKSKQVLNNMSKEIWDEYKLFKKTQSGS